MVDNPSKDYRENADDCRAQAARDQPGENEAWLDDVTRVASENAQQSLVRHLRGGGDHDTPFRGRPRAVS